MLAKYDDESTKTVGLTNVIIQEAGRPRCDVFWNNEILNTLRLEEKGLLEPITRRRPTRFQRCIARRRHLARLCRPGARADRQYERS